MCLFYNKKINIGLFSKLETEPPYKSFYHLFQIKNLKYFVMFAYTSMLTGVGGFRDALKLMNLV